MLRDGFTAERAIAAWMTFHSHVRPYSALSRCTSVEVVRRGAGGVTSSTTKREIAGVRRQDARLASGDTRTAVVCRRRCCPPARAESCRFDAKTNADLRVAGFPAALLVVVRSRPDRTARFAGRRNGRHRPSESRVVRMTGTTSIRITDTGPVSGAGIDHTHTQPPRAYDCRS